MGKPVKIQNGKWSALGIIHFFLILTIIIPVMGAGNHVNKFLINHSLQGIVPF